MLKLSEPTNEPSSTTTNPAISGLKKRRTRLAFRASPNDLKSLASKRLPRKEAALSRFLKGTGIRPSQVENAPNLTRILGKRTSVIDAMRFSQEPAVIEFLKVYDSTPVCDRKQVPFEAVALKAQCNFSELLGAIILSFRSVQAQKSAVLAMGSHPDVVQATINDALSVKGAVAQKMLHEAVGFLPTPKGTSINFNLGQNDKPEEDEDKESAPEINELFPMITERQEKWQADRSRLLESDN